MSRRKFDYTGHPCEPQDLSDNAWFYAQKDGIVICCRTRSGDPSELAVMPWQMVKRALADHEKAKERRPTQESGGRT